MAVLILAGSFYVGRLGAQMHQMHHQTTAAVSQEAKVRKVVVDAGHGGFDSGKVGINGALEKDINLEIARKVQQKLELIKNYDLGGAAEWKLGLEDDSVWDLIAKYVS